MSRIGLTRRQRDLLEFIEQYCASGNGVSPSYEEMKDALGLKSKSGIYRLTHALAQRGFIRMLPNCARSIVPISSSGVRGVFVELNETDMARLQSLSAKKNSNPSSTARAILSHQLWVEVDLMGRAA